MSTLWIHLYADTNCGRGCRVVERHGAIVGRSLDVLTVQLYDWDVIDGRVPRPIPGAVLRIEHDEVIDLGAVIYPSYKRARADELQAVLRGLGNCGHGQRRPTRGLTRDERAHRAELHDLGVLSPEELTQSLLDDDLPVTDADLGIEQ